MTSFLLGLVLVDIPGCVRRDRLATGRRQPSLHMDVRLLARPAARSLEYPPATPDIEQFEMGLSTLSGNKTCNGIHWYDLPP